MPPEMIATEKYKKLPAGCTFKCSSSSAKALSALGMANYHNAASVPVMTREMSAGPEFTSQAGSQVASVLSVPEAPVLSEARAAVEVALSTTDAEPSSVSSNSTIADVPCETDGQPTTETVTPVVPAVLEPTPAPVTGSVNTSTEDATIVANKQKDSQKSVGNQYGNKKSDSGNQKSSVTAKNSPYKK